MENSGYFAKKALLLLMALAFTSPFALEAVSIFKGQLVYLKECRVCHLSSRIFVDTHSAEEWEKILDTNGTRLSDIHLNTEEKYVNSKERIRKSSHKYFKTDEYKQKYDELRAFIVKSAKKNQEREENYR